MEGEGWAGAAGFWWCVSAAGLTALLLLAKWYQRPSCLLFLKAQFCLSTTALMGLVLYLSHQTLKQEFFMTVTIIAEALLLLNLSSQLSKLLLTYSDIVDYPRQNKHLKSSVIATVLGCLSVLTSLLAQSISGRPLPAAWLPVDSIVFIIFAGHGSLLVLLFLFLFFDLSTKLAHVAKVQKDKKEFIITRRIGLIRRAAILLISSVLMIISSFRFYHSPTRLNYYMFSALCGSLGVLILLFYVICPETPFGFLSLIKADKKREKEKEKEKKQKELALSSESDNNLFDFYTKGEGDAESGNAPPCLKTPLSPKDHRPQSAIKMVTFKGDSPVHTASVMSRECSVEKNVDLEEYPSSPRKYQLPVDLIPVSGGRGESPSPPPPPPPPESLPPPVSPPPAPPPPATVLDQISHDLHYLLHEPPDPLSPSKHVKTTL